MSLRTERIATNKENKITRWIERRLLTAQERKINSQNLAIDRRERFLKELAAKPQLRQRIIQTVEPEVLEEKPLREVIPFKRSLGLGRQGEYHSRGAGQAERAEIDLSGSLD